MKKVFIVAALAMAAVSAQAQINKGQFMIGGTLGVNSSKFGDDGTRVTNTNINPNVGYFFINNLAGGLRLDVESQKVKDQDADSRFAISPFVRYYFLPAAQKVNVFADASFGIGSAGGDDKESFNQFSIMAGPAVFLTPNVALEFAVGYKSLGGDFYGNDERNNTIGLNVGFQIHLGGK